MKVPNLLTFLIVSSVALASELRGDQRVKSSARQKRALAVDDPNNFNFFRSCAESCQYSPKSHNPAWKCQRECNHEFGFKISNDRDLCFSKCDLEANYGRENSTFVKGKWQRTDGGKPPGQ